MSNTPNIKERIQEYERGLAVLKKETGLDPVITLEFPQYRVLPVEIQLALEILQKHKYQFMLTYKETNDQG